MFLIVIGLAFFSLLAFGIASQMAITITRERDWPWAWPFFASILFLGLLTSGALIEIITN